MIFILYAIVALGVVALSVKASNYVDMLDKTTKLSGAFIGGIMLSAVTSLPELFTSISSTVLLDKPELCIGNILGSDLFNLAALSAVMLIFYKVAKKSNVSAIHLKIAVLVMLVYGIIIINMMGWLNFEIFTVNITSIAIVVIYILGVTLMAKDTDKSCEEQEETVEITLTTKQIVTRFVLTSVGIIVLSIAMTYITDAISIKLHIGSGLAGALFLGVATSLPELSSTIQLFRIHNMNIAVGNIVGSNLFNFVILAIADIVYLGNGIYNFSDPQTLNLLIFGGIAGVTAVVMLGLKNKVFKVICPIIMVCCYIAFLVV